MLAAPTPRRQRWVVGSIFAVPRRDGTWAFGQVVSSAGPGLGATLAPYEHRQPGAKIARERIEEIITSRTLTILHTTASDLNDGTFRVVGDGPCIVDPDAGPLGPRSAGRSWDAISTIANAWYGFYLILARDENWLDRGIMRGPGRPQVVWLLGPDEPASLRAAERYGPILHRMIAERVEGLGEPGG